MSYTAAGAAAGTAIAPGLGTAIGAGLGVVGDIVAGNASADAQREANQTNRDIARENREWQASMSSTAYQRAMADMRAAGLNPILAYSQGGASTPSGSTTNVQAVEPTVSRVASSAADAMNMYQQVRGQDAAIKQQEAQTMVAQAQAAKTITDAKNATLQGKILEAEVPVRQIRLEADKEFQKFDAWLERIGAAFGLYGTAVGAAMKTPGVGSKRPVVIKAGTRRETRALNKAGAKGIDVIP